MQDKIKYMNGVYKHRENVSKYMSIFIKDLVDRNLTHDISKLEGNELEYFSKVPPIDKNATYNGAYVSDNTEEELAHLSIALANHYTNNDHHPEHFTDGIEDMDLIQLLQMLSDWKAGTLKISEGDIKKSIEYNRERFGMDDQLFKILMNTADRYLIDKTE